MCLITDSFTAPKKPHTYQARGHPHSLSSCPWLPWFSLKAPPPTPSVANSPPGPAWVLAFICCCFWANSHRVVQLSLNTVFLPLRLSQRLSLTAHTRLSFPFLFKRTSSFNATLVSGSCRPAWSYKSSQTVFSVFFLCLTLAVSKLQVLRWRLWYRLKWVLYRAKDGGSSFSILWISTFPSSIC